MKSRKKVTPINSTKKKVTSNSSQVHVVSSGIKAKKAPGGCGSCGKKRRYQ